MRVDALKKSEIPLFFVFWFVSWELVNQNMLPIVIISKGGQASSEYSIQNPKSDALRLYKSKIVRLMLH